jgi:integrase/recombinase XerD
MDWQSAGKGFKQYLILERSLSANSIEAYRRDVSCFENFLLTSEPGTGPLKVTYKHLLSFVEYLTGLGIAASSQARMVSGLRAFYKYLLMEDIIVDDPTQFLELPRKARKLPEVLSADEIDKMIACIDLSKPMGHRDKAMLETLFACGLRVSELVGLNISEIFPKDKYIKVRGKGNKERLVPIGKIALKSIDIYINEVRVHQKMQKKHTDTLFLNRSGSSLSRVFIFKMIKELAKQARITKNISPHTFRHSFATCLVEGGADLRAVQQMLGHESITTTEIYTHLDQTFLKKVIRDFHPRSVNNLKSKV